MSVHNHPPYRPVCNERNVDGQLRGACLNDNGTPNLSTSEGEGSVSERTDRINGHSVVYRDHRFVCLHCQVRLLSVMQFHTRACPGDHA